MYRANWTIVDLWSQNMCCCSNRLWCYYRGGKCRQSSTLFARDHNGAASVLASSHLSSKKSPECIVREGSNDSSKNAKQYHDTQEKKFIVQLKTADHIWIDAPIPSTISILFIVMVLWSSSVWESFIIIHHRFYKTYRTIQIFR